MCIDVPQLRWINENGFGAQRDDYQTYIRLMTKKELKLGRCEEKVNNSIFEKICFKKSYFLQANS